MVFKGQNAANIPTLDQMASKWLAVDEIVHMPSLHNSHEMGACSPNCSGELPSGGQLYADVVSVGMRIIACLVKLLIDGQTHTASRCRWFHIKPYEAALLTSGGDDKRTDGI